MYIAHLISWDQRGLVHKCSKRRSVFGTNSSCNLMHQNTPWFYHSVCSGAAAPLPSAFLTWKAHHHRKVGFQLGTVGKQSRLAMIGWLLDDWMVDFAPNEQLECMYRSSFSRFQAKHLRTASKAARLKQTTQEQNCVRKNSKRYAGFQNVQTVGWMCQRFMLKRRETLSSFLQLGYCGRINHQRKISNEQSLRRWFNRQGLGGAIAGAAG